jgi:hypothetical protein
LLIPFVAAVGAGRLAKRRSPWSRWFYEPSRGARGRQRNRARKLERASRRYGTGWQGRLDRKVADLIGGAPSTRPAEERRRT